MKILSYFSFYLCLILLTSCSSNRAPSEGGIGQLFSDRSIAFRINNQFYGNKALYANNHIVVAVKNGVVLLAGQALTTTAIQQAEGIAKAISGIRLLYNEIQIMRPTTIAQQLRDSSITTAVEVKLLGSKGINSNAIKVVTENNVVYLMGDISREMAEQATDVTRRINGVKKVVKVFQYTQD